MKDRQFGCYTHLKNSKYWISGIFKKITFNVNGINIWWNIASGFLQHKPPKLTCEEISNNGIKASIFLIVPYHLCYQ